MKPHKKSSKAQTKKSSPQRPEEVAPAKEGAPTGPGEIEAQGSIAPLPVGPPAKPELELALTASAPPPLPALTPSLTPEDLYRQAVREEIEAKRYLSGGFLTLVGGILTNTPRYLKADGHERIGLNRREFSLLAILAWHSFKLARRPAPPLLDAEAFLPLEDFMAVEDILAVIDLLKKRYPSISIWENATKDTVHKVVTELRKKLRRARIYQFLIETGQTGGYRLSLPPRNLQLVLDNVPHGRRDLG